jgi:hypothetical protein
VDEGGKVDTGCGCQKVACAKPTDRGTWRGEKSIAITDEPSVMAHPQKIFSRRLRGLVQKAVTTSRQKSAPKRPRRLGQTTPRIHLRFRWQNKPAIFVWHGGSTLKRLSTVGLISFSFWTDHVLSRFYILKPENHAIDKLPPERSQ